MITAEAVAGGVWQVLHHYIENDSTHELPRARAQLIYLTLVPFVGPERAAAAAEPAVAIS